MRVVIFDNLDSFTHNLAQALGGLGADVVTCRPDRATRSILACAPDRLVLSPGPGRPEEASACERLLREAAGSVPVLGVCLGMQVIARAWGAAVERAPEPVHGRATAVLHDGLGVYAGVANPFMAGRYHSLAVVPDTLPAGLVPTAWSDGVLMGLRHATLAIEGVQFHPESVLTPLGHLILANFVAPPPARSVHCASQATDDKFL